MLIAVGLWAFLEKFNATGWMKLETVYDIILNISLVLMILGMIVFIVGFTGFVGALRENTCLLRFVSYSSFLISLFRMSMNQVFTVIFFPSFPVFILSTSLFSVGNGRRYRWFHISFGDASYLGRIRN